MRIVKYPLRNEWEALSKRPEIEVSRLYDTVRTILDDVRTGGDAAVIRYAERFDHVRLTSIRVSDDEIAEASTLISEDLKRAIKTAAGNIEKFHAAQRFEALEVETMPGVYCRQKAVPIEKVGLYVPGGTAPLFSSVLMLGIPAQIAGCSQIVLFTPSTPEGKVHPAILFAAQTAGITQVFKVGGVQAIAAMAYGTESVPKVYKIFGPGNQYVTAAKQLVSINDVAIDMPAGPSEVAIIADEQANPAFIAADFLSQAEHGSDSQSVLLTTSETLAEDVEKEVLNQLQLLPRQSYITKSLSNSLIIVLKDSAEIVEYINIYAPEHLIIQTADYKKIGEKIVNAGSVFLGAYTPESAGDYASGTNHTLPTKGFSKMYNGVNLDSFVRKITFQEITREGLSRLGNTIEIMAESELLMAHRNAVSIRLIT